MPGDRGVNRAHFDDLCCIPLSIVWPEDEQLFLQYVLCEITLGEKAEDVLHVP